MTYWAAYLTVVVGGPLLMLLLTRGVATQLGFVLGMGLVVALLTAMLISDAVPGLATLTMLWLAWVGTVSLCVRAVMRRIKTRRGLALTKALGAMACVIPWIGLATADWMAG